MILVGGWTLPLWKRLEFVNWDDEIPKINGKIKVMFQENHQPVVTCKWQRFIHWMDLQSKYHTYPSTQKTASGPPVMAQKNPSIGVSFHKSSWDDLWRSYGGIIWCQSSNPKLHSSSWTPSPIFYTFRWNPNGAPQHNPQICHSFWRWIQNLPSLRKASCCQVQVTVLNLNGARFSSTQQLFKSNEARDKVIRIFARITSARSFWDGAIE